VIVLAALAAAGCTAPGSSSGAGSSCGTGAGSGPARPPRTVAALPPPDVHGTVPLEQALAARRSVRRFRSEPLGDARLGQLFWSAQGITHGEQGRPAPSAGALYPLQLYAVGADAILRYLPEGHRAERWTEPGAGAGLARAAGGQQAVALAPTVLVVTAALVRTAGRYGSRAQRYVDLEAGHATQNILLQAVATGLAAVPIGSFDDDAVAAVLRLSRAEAPRYLVPVGLPATA
jgi:SagB-type dehydrogenase family enzyme